MHLIFCLLRLALIAFLLLPLEGQTAGPLPAKKWTVMVYMCADNNLEPLALKDLALMEQALPDNAHVMVLFDRSRGYTQDYGNWTGTRLFYVRRSGHTQGRVSQMNMPQGFVSEMLQDLGELDMSDPRNITAFIRESAARCPAENYIFIPWNHGGGWQSNLADEDGGSGRPGLGSMSGAEIAEAIREALPALPKKKFDAILFNMCLMGHMEILHEMQGLTDYIFASAPPIPGDSLQYDLILSQLSRDLPVRELVASLPGIHADFYNQGSLQEAAFSAYDMSKLPDLLQALTETVKDLSSLTREHYAQVSRASFYAASMWDVNTDIKNGIRGFWAVSLADWLNRLEHELPDLDRRKLKRVRECIEALIMSTSASKGITHGRGIGIYLPPRRDFYNPLFSETAYAAETGMDKFLEALYAAQDSQSSTPKVSNLVLGNARLRAGRSGREPEDFDIDTSGEILSFDKGVMRFDVTGHDILRTILMEYELQGQKNYVNTVSMVVDLTDREDTGEGNFGAISPVYRDGTTTLLRGVTGQRFVVTNGSQSAPISVLHTNTTDQISGNTSEAYGLYSHPRLGGQEIPVIINFSNVTRSPISVNAVITDGNGHTTAAAVMLENGGTFRPGRIVVGMQNGKVSGQQLEYGQPIALQSGVLLLSMALIPDNSLVGIAISAESMGGKTVSAISNPMRVRQNPDQRAMMNNAANNYASNLFGRYVMVQYMQDSAGDTAAPTFDTLVLKEQNNAATWELIGADGRSTYQGIFMFLSAGTTPTLTLFDRPKNPQIPVGTRIVKNWYAFLQGQGQQRIWYLIESGIATRWALFPVAFFSQAVEGQWQGPSGRWSFRNGQVEHISPDGVRSTGTYSLRDHILTTTSLPMANSFAVMPDRRRGRLSLTYAKSNGSAVVLELSRDSGTATAENSTPAGPRQQHDSRWPSSQPLSATCNSPLCGYWVNDAAGARLSFTVQPGTPYYLLNLQSYSRQIYCTVTVGPDVLFSTDTNGNHQNIGYSLVQDQLTLRFSGMPPITFRRQP